VLALAHKLGMKGSDLAQAAAVETVGDVYAFVEPQLEVLKRRSGYKRVGTVRPRSDPQD
jgi:hypothetical protein